MEYRLYTVLPGNTLWGIANFFGTTVEELAELNNITNPELIFPGIVLKVPVRVPPLVPKRYTVRPGDTVWSIANRYNLSVNDILKYNNLPNPNLIYPGQSLTLSK